MNAYIEDLLNRNFIRKSNSSYSSPVVCVRRKDQSLRLCVDYRALNQKTVPDRHPIPRIQESLDNLGGNAWFSVLAQGEAYQQGYISDTDQHLTAFITPSGLYNGFVFHVVCVMPQGPFSVLWKTVSVIYAIMYVSIPRRRNCFQQYF